MYKSYDITYQDAYGRTVTDRARGKTPKEAVADLYSLYGFIQKIISVKLCRWEAQDGLYFILSKKKWCCFGSF